MAGIVIEQIKSQKSVFTACCVFNKLLKKVKSSFRQDNEQVCLKEVEKLIDETGIVQEITRSI